MGKLGSALVCLVFAVPFGGVGVFATWAIGSALHDAWRARQWMPVEARVEAASLHTSSGSEGGDTYRAEATYRYAYGGRTHAGSRLGFSAIGGADNIDDWHQEVSARLESARASGRPVTVWVNPDNPAESVYDRGVRWGELLFLTPFSLAFGGVGVGALVAMGYVLKGKGGGPGGARPQAALDRAIGTAAAAVPGPAGSMAQRAERAMFDRPSAAFDRPGAAPSAARLPGIPPELAEVEERGGVLAIRYRPRRRMGLVIALAMTGLFLAGFGVVVFLTGGSMVLGIAVFAAGALFDVAAAGVLVGRLAVTAKAGELNVERVSLGGRKSWRIRGDHIRAIRPVQAYAINEEPYYSIFADLGTERVALGNSIKGEALAHAVAQRIAAALGLEASRVEKPEPDGTATQRSGA